MRKITILFLAMIGGAHAEPASIFYWSDADTPVSGDVFRISIAGGEPENLTLDIGARGAWSPEVSHDGTSLAYVARDEENSRGQIWLSDLHLQNRLQLTEGERHSHPSWAPDGRRLVMRTTTDRSLSDLPDNRCLKGDTPASYFLGCNDLFVLDLDSGLKTNISANPDFDYMPAWSPTGDEIAFLRMHAGYSGDIWLYADGPVSRLTHTGGYVSKPSWSPDGRFLAAGKSTEDGEGVFILDPSRGDERLLTSSIRLASEPSWSRDGQVIAFRVWENAAASIWTIRPDGSGLRKLADLTSNTVTNLSWTPGEIPQTAIVSPSWGRVKEAIAPWALHQ